jgi:MFS transporter, NNP family, nitrate/nitrite transporter
MPPSIDEKTDMARYAFPPLLKSVIATDLKLSQPQVLTSNIIALLATLLVRLVAGPCCDAFGPRKTFAGCLLIGAIPTFLAGTIQNFGGLCAIRFFVGILGGSFVPCQVWTTAFYDKNIVGTANSLTGGFGNSGGGVTYFVMPAVYNSLRSQGLSSDKAWRVSFVVPGILIVSVAIALLVFTPDTPTGKWKDREVAVQRGIGSISGQGAPVAADSDTEKGSSGNITPPNEDKKDLAQAPIKQDTQVGEQYNISEHQQEVIMKPTWKEAMKVVSSPQTLVLGAVSTIAVSRLTHQLTYGPQCYASSFGAELAVNSILGSYFKKNNPQLTLQGSGNWAAMFGLMNVVFRPLGGAVADYVYKRTHSLWAKKILLHSYCALAGVFLIATGLTDRHNDLGWMVGLLCIGFAFFDEGANGLNFALVPHVHPYANGIVSGVTGACGNLGGIIFAIVYRYGGDYHKATWIIGVIMVALQVLTFWIKPVPSHRVI